VPASRERLAWVGAVVAALPLVVYGLTMRAPERLLDLAVYRAGGLAVLHGRDLHGFSTSNGLPFTYPPVAGLLAVPLALLPVALGGLLWLLGCLAALAWSACRLAEPLVWWAGPVLLVGVSWTEPVRDVFRFGQVGTLLLALCVADLIGPARRGRGALVGLAAAVKLTPAVFLPLLWLGGRRREAITAAATAVGLSLAAAVVLPTDSLRAWRSGLWGVSRVRAAGGSANPGDQALHGMLLRAGLPAWLLAALLAAVVPLGRWWWVRSRW